MSAVERIDAAAVAPDGIEPVEHLRAWTFDLAHKKLRSLNGQSWTPGEPLVAKCHASGAQTYSWNVVRRGITLEQAQRKAADINQSFGSFSFSSFSPPRTYNSVASPPKIELPVGYGFALETAPPHDAPHEDCSCGIYAAETEAQIPGGNVFGKVKLWGKIVPGERGVRAEFAYPSEFHVTADLADDPVLKAFGVPIIVKDELPKTASNSMPWPSFNFSVPQALSPSPARFPWSLRIAIGVNAAAAVLNITLAVLRVH